MVYQDSKLCKRCLASPGIRSSAVAQAPVTNVCVLPGRAACWQLQNEKAKVRMSKGTAAQVVFPFPGYLKCEDKPGVSLSSLFGVSVPLSAVVIREVGRTGNKNCYPQNFDFFCLNFYLISFMINYCPHLLCDYPHLLFYMCWGKWQ